MGRWENVEAGVLHLCCVALIDAERDGLKQRSLLNAGQAVRIFASERRQRWLIYVVPTVQSVE